MYISISLSPSHFLSLSLSLSLSHTHTLSHSLSYFLSLSHSLSLTFSLSCIVLLNSIYILIPSTCTIHKPYILPHSYLVLAQYIYTLLLHMLFSHSSLSIVYSRTHLNTFSFVARSLSQLHYCILTQILCLVFNFAQSFIPSSDSEHAHHCHTLPLFLLTLSHSFSLLLLTDSLSLFSYSLTLCSFSHIHIHIHKNIQKRIFLDY